MFGGGIKKKSKRKKNKTKEIKKLNDNEMKI